MEVPPIHAERAVDLEALRYPQITQITQTREKTQPQKGPRSTKDIASFTHDFSIGCVISVNPLTHRATQSRHSTPDTPNATTRWVRFHSSTEHSSWGQACDLAILQRAAKLRPELSPGRGFASLGLSENNGPEPRSGDRIYIQRYFSSNSIP